MDKIELIDRAAVIADLKKQFAAVYKDTMLRPIMDDDPFVELLAKSEGRHMQLFLDGLEEYLMTRPTIDAAPVRRGEWRYVNYQIDKTTWITGEFICRKCGKSIPRRMGDNPPDYCQHCGADMRRADDEQD